MVVGTVLSETMQQIEAWSRESGRPAELMSNMEKSTRSAHVLIEDVQFDLYYATPEEWGAMTLFLTGSKLFNILIRAKAKELGYKLNQYGLWHGAELIAGRTEEQIFYALEMENWSPERRSLSGKTNVRL
jgi:DNA polymerase (family 10)